MDKRILIVDDEPNVRMSYCAALELSGDFKIAARYYGQSLRINKDFVPAQQNAKRIDELAWRGTSKEPFALGLDELFPHLLT